ncbi:MAG: GNAT family N-acetyltransferase [Acidobacteriota bacterium]
MPFSPPNDAGSSAIEAVFSDRPSRLGTVGDVPAAVARRIGGDEILAQALRPEALEGDLDAVIVQGAEPLRARAAAGGLTFDRGLAAVRARLAPRGRVAWTVPSNERRAAILAMSRGGWSIRRELGGTSDGGTSDGGTRDGETTLVARPDPYLLRPYRAGDEHDILRLFAPSFHATRGLAHWRWKYLDNPWGATRITAARAPDGKLVAHYAAYPVPMCDGAAEWIALQVGDTMTAPEVRAVGRGPTSLLGRAARHFYAAFCDDRVAFNYGFNTGNIRRFSERFVRAEKVEDVAYRTRGAEPPEVAGRRLDVRAVREVGGAFDRFFERVAGVYPLLIRRDAIYLRWRYLDCPDEPPFLLFSARRSVGPFRGRLVGWAVFRRRGAMLRWVDALVDPAEPNVGPALLAAAARHPMADTVQGVEAWFPDRPLWWHRTLEDLGFVRRPEPDELALMCVPHQVGDAAQRLRRAYYTLGDGDLA